MSTEIHLSFGILTNSTVKKVVKRAYNAGILLIAAGNNGKVEYERVICRAK